MNREVEEGKGVRECVRKEKMEGGGGERRWREVEGGGSQHSTSATWTARPPREVSLYFLQQDSQKYFRVK